MPAAHVLAAKDHDFVDFKQPRLCHCHGSSHFEKGKGWHGIHISTVLPQIRLDSLHSYLEGGL
jgi:hypothetical protein